MPPVAAFGWWSSLNSHDNDGSFRSSKFWIWACFVFLTCSLLNPLCSRGIDLDYCYRPSHILWSGFCLFGNQIIESGDCPHILEDSSGFGGDYLFDAALFSSDYEPGRTHRFVRDSITLKRLGGYEHFVPGADVLPVHDEQRNSRPIQVEVGGQVRDYRLERYFQPSFKQIQRCSRRGMIAKCFWHQRIYVKRSGVGRCVYFKCKTCLNPYIVFGDMNLASRPSFIPLTASELGISSNEDTSRCIENQDSRSKAVRTEKACTQRKK